MLVRFWGTRGSIPAPGPQTARYGGNTSCIEVWPDDSTVIILDSGTGIRELGLQLLRSAKPIDRMYLLIGHMHWDHIQGFPFFKPAFLPSTELNIFAPAGFQRSLEDSLSGQMQYSYFPIKLQDLSGRIHYTELEEGFFRIGNVLVETQYLNHTAPALAYRITAGGTTLTYVTDHEPYWNSPGPEFQHPGDQRHIEFLKGSDLVIHDAQYTELEYRSKRGWGHSTVDYATDVAMAANVARLALFHHDPTHEDDMIESLEQHARARVAAAGSSLNVFAAAERMEIALSGSGIAATLHEESALRRCPTSGGRILLVTDNHQDASTIERALAEDGLAVTLSPNGESALGQIENFSPDLVILDSRLRDGEGTALVQPIRSRLDKPELPVLILTADYSSVDALEEGQTSTATDYIPKPFSPPMLRSRVRAWLARTMISSRADLQVTGQAADAETVSQTLPPIDFDHIRALVSLFSPLDGKQLERMLSRSSQRIYPTGHAVVNQGKPGHNVYVVLTGRVRIVEAMPDNPVEMFLGELGPGEVFGELGIMHDRPRSATAIPLERTRCLIIPESDFVEAYRGSAEMAVALAQVLAKRLYEADRSVARYGPDPLTGLPGRRALNDLYARLSAGVRRRGGPIVLLTADVVHLKAINDRYGYNVGDEVLRAAADVLLDSSRGTDIVARYGGDEFAALFVEAHATHAEVLVTRVEEKFRQVIAERNLPATAELRIGQAVCQPPPDTLEEFLRMADLEAQSRRPEARSTLQ
jgi:diguanylate cyclase (GGDEF)-like protein